MTRARQDDDSDDDDSDLVDLLEDTTTDRGRGGANQAIQTMNLDHLTTSGIRVSQSPRNQNHNNSNNSKKKKTNRNHQQPMPCCDFVTSYTAMLCHYYPKCCACLTTTFLLLAMLFLANFLWNPVQELGVLDDNTFFQIHSKYDLNIGKVDHWCLRGGNDRCRCEDPLQPLGRMEHLSWIEAVKANRLLLEPYQTAPIDLAILGESVVEAMGGRWMSKTRSSQMGNLGNLFQRKFNGQTNGISAVALGVAGDTAPNVLWRLLHGEMPDYFQPKIWWISLGMNDLARMGCSEEIVVLGILRVVEEIMEKRPKAHIVINSVLPMANVRGGAYPLVSDYSEALKPPRQLRFHAPPESGRAILVPSLFQRRLDRKDRKGTVAPNAVEDIKDPKKREKAMAEKAEQIEQQRAKNNPKRWKRREPASAKLDAREKVRTFPVGGKLFDKIPMWTSIQAINRQLRKFTEMSEHNSRVHFYDATQLFVDRTKGKARVKGGLITLTGYPRQAGFEVWEDAILAFSKPILEEMKKSNPELFGLSVSEDANDDDDENLEEDDQSSMEDDSAI